MDFADAAGSPMPRGCAKAAVTATFQALHAWCGTADAFGRSGLLLGLFLAGAAGSTLHCAPMCGGFVLGQVADRMAAMPLGRLCEWRRLGAGALLPYHAGRLATYTGLGAAAGWGGAVLSGAPWFGALSALLLLTAAGLFLLHALRRSVPTLGRLLPRLDSASAAWRRLVSRAVASLNPAGGQSTADGLRSGFLLGVVLGFLPCGFLYAALAASAATASPELGALGMLAFGLGTAPALIVLGIAGQAAGWRWQRGVAVFGPALMMLNAVLLAMLALQRLAALMA